MAITAITVAILAFIPVSRDYQYGGHSWNSVPPSGYYLARIREIKDGYPLLGNPFILEHKDGLAPAFFIPDWIATIPYLLGASLLMVIAINNVLWALVFVLLLYILFRRLELSPIVTSVGSLFAYTQVYSLMQSQVSMQIIFPFYLFFLITLFDWLNDIENSKKQLLIALATSLTLYTYNYTAQVAFLTLILIGCVFIFRKKWKYAMNTISIGLWSALFSLPAIVITLNQLRNQYYFETLRRIGVVYSHLPVAEVWYSGRWIVAGIVFLFIILSIAKQDKKRLWATCGSLSSIGVGMFAVGLTNVISGLELETAQHIQRFVIVWLVIVVFVGGRMLLEIFRNGDSGKKGYVLLGLFTILCLGNYSYFGDVNEVFGSINSKYIEERQEYAAPLEYIDEQESEPVVIWTRAGSELSSYVQVLSRNYSLFENMGILHLLSTGEVEERYLVSKYLEDPKKEDIMDDLQLFAGSAVNRHDTNVRNRWNRLCTILHLSIIGADCLTPITREEYNKGYVDLLYARYEKEIVPNIAHEVSKYNVKYIIKDKVNDEEFTPERLEGVMLVYEDARFSVYKK